MAAYPEIANNQPLLEPGFNFDQLELKIIDVSTLEPIAITPGDRQAIAGHIAATQKQLIPLKEAAERYRERLDAGTLDKK